MWYVIGAIVVYVLYKFLIAASEDNKDVRDNPLHVRYSHFFGRLNKEIFNGEASVNQKAPHIYTLYKEDSNQILIFEYALGSMDIKWMYKYYQKELVHEQTLNNIKNVSVFEQDKLAEIVLNAMAPKIKRHKASVNSDMTPENFESVLSQAMSSVQLEDKHKSVEFTEDDKIAAVSLMTTMAAIDEEVDRRESKVISNNLPLLGIEITEYFAIIMYIKENDYGVENAIPHLQDASRIKKDILLLILNEIAIADGVLHDNESTIMAIFGSTMGYKPKEMMDVIEHFEKASNVIPMSR